MCVVAAKYFPGIGFVGVKNRDRNYTPDLSFPRKQGQNTERLLMHDDITKFTEGLNNHGVCILTASLMVQDDEKEITKRSKTPSKDGTKIARALELPTVMEALRFLIKNKLPGNTLIFDRETCYLLEGTWKPGRYKDRHYVYKARKIPHNETICRTNHGIWLPWAGYQEKADDKSQTLSAISSHARYMIARHVVENARTPEDMIDGLCKQYNDNPQLNALRMDYKGKEMRTTAQLMLCPSEKTLYIRPVASNINFDFWKLNRPNSNTWIEILSNRALYQHTKGDPPFPQLSHTQD